MADLTLTNLCGEDASLKCTDLAGEFVQMYAADNDGDLASICLDPHEATALRDWLTAWLLEKGHEQ